MKDVFTLITRSFLLVMIPFFASAQVTLRAGGTFSSLRIKSNNSLPYEGLKRNYAGAYIGLGYQQSLGNTFHLVYSADYLQRYMKSRVPFVTEANTKSLTHHYASVGVKAGVTLFSALHVRVGGVANVLLASPNQTDWYRKSNAIEPLAVGELGYSLGRLELQAGYQHPLGAFATMQPTSIDTRTFRFYNPSFYLGAAFKFKK